MLVSVSRVGNANENKEFERGGGVPYEAKLSSSVDFRCLAMGAVCHWISVGILLYFYWMSIGFLLDFYCISLGIL